ncbi:MAG: SH3 domain-containing protein [Chloroflexi bacterium]|jgi:hypothetical protein|nr:SH3 domain-containing protein [Chloroflexota bacterium]
MNNPKQPIPAARRIPVVLLAAISILAACVLPAPTAAPPTVTPTAAVGACTFTALEETALYLRPDPASEVFLTEEAGFAASIQAKTSGGWLGFDPGIPQADNVGPFRLRWIAPGARGELSGDCSAVDAIWGPPAGICFQMPLQDTSVYAGPDENSAVVTVLNEGEFPAVTGLSTDGNWARVDFTPGNTGTTETGWIAAAALNLNGPCSFLSAAYP